MLKFLHLGAALAAVLSSQVTGSLPSVPEDTANQWAQASTHKLVVTEETANADTDVINANSILTADSSNNTPGVAEKLGPVGTMLVVAAVGGGAAAVILSAKSQSPATSDMIPYSRSNGNSYKSSSTLSHESKENTIRLEQASRKLQKKLLRLLHDERDTALRLVSQVKMKNPDRSINWCVEKVIYDLERDRGSY